MPEIRIGITPERIDLAMQWLAVLFSVAIVIPSDENTRRYHWKTGKGKKKKRKQK